MQTLIFLGPPRQNLYFIIELKIPHFLLIRAILIWINNISRMFVIVVTCNYKGVPLAAPIPRWCNQHSCTQLRKFNNCCNARLGEKGKLKFLLEIYQKSWNINLDCCELSIQILSTELSTMAIKIDTPYVPRRTFPSGFTSLAAHLDNSSKSRERKVKESIISMSAMLYIIVVTFLSLRRNGTKKI